MIQNSPAYAVPYLRVSSKGQILGDGFDRQLDTIQKRAEFENIFLKTVVREEGVSGTKDSGDRPALSSLLEALVQDPECSTILVERADRVARDLIVSELLLKECRELGITVIEAESGQDLTKDDPDDPTSRLIRQLLAAVAEFEKSSLVLKLRKARQRKKGRGTGGKEGQKPYGALEHEKDGLRRIQELIDDGYGPSVIAECLNLEQIVTRRGGKWTKQSVHTIVQRLRVEHVEDVTDPAVP